MTVVPSKPFRLAIFEADLPAPNTEKKYGGYGPVFQRLLRRACASLNLPYETTLEITTYPVWIKDEYPSLDDIDGILITGSKFNAFDPLPWITRLVEYTKQAIETERVKVVGICFGHQIAARALGGEVVRNEKGWEVAVINVGLSDVGKEFFGKDRIDIYQMHRDMVPRLPSAPKGKTISNLGSTDVCNIQGMYIPKALVSVQGHPEFDQDIVQELVKARTASGIFTQEFCDDALGRLGVDHGVEIGARFLRFLLEE